MQNKNESIFPVAKFEYHQNGEGIAWTEPEGGLTKREIFAAMAMQGFLACQQGSISTLKIAEFAVKQADELIKALEK